MGLLPNSNGVSGTGEGKSVSPVFGLRMGVQDV